MFNCNCEDSLRVFQPCKVLFKQTVMVVTETNNWKRNAIVSNNKMSKQDQNKGICICYIPQPGCALSWRHQGSCRSKQLNGDQLKLVH